MSWSKNLHNRDFYILTKWMSLQNDPIQRYIIKKKTKSDPKIRPFTNLWTTFKHKNQFNWTTLNFSWNYAWLPMYFSTLSGFSIGGGERGPIPTYPFYMLSCWSSHIQNIYKKEFTFYYKFCIIQLVCQYIRRVFFSSLRSIFYLCYYKTNLLSIIMTIFIFLKFKLWWAV